MATVIDSLVVELGLDPEKFKKGSEQQQAAYKKLTEGFTKGSKEMSGQADKLLISLNNLKNTVLSLLGAYLSFEAIKSFTLNLTQAGTSLDRLNVLTGVSKIRIAEWQNVMKDWGGTAEDANNVLGNIASRIQEFVSTGNLQAVGVLRVLGASQSVGAAADAVKHGRTPDYEAILFQALEGIHRNQQLGKYYGEQLSFPAPLIAHAISEGVGGPGGIRAQLDAQRANAEAAAKAAAEEKNLTKALAELDNRFTALGHSILVNLIPTIDKVTTLLDRLSKGDWSGAIHTDIPLPKTGVGWLDRPVKTGGGWWDFLTQPVGPEGVQVQPAKSGRRAATAVAPHSATSVNDLLRLIWSLENPGYAFMDPSRNRVRSPAGAIGLFQVMPKTGAHYGATAKELEDPKVNERVARAYLADLVKQYGGNLQDILVKYNASTAAFRRFKATGDLNLETYKYLMHAGSLLGLGGASSLSGVRVAPNQTINVGPITINTRAVDAAGIARGLRGAIARTKFATQSDTGPM